MGDCTRIRGEASRIAVRFLSWRLWRSSRIWRSVGPATIGSASGSSPSSADYFTNEIRANPSNGSAYMSRGHIWDGKKEYDKAIADYNEAIRLDPK